ncbi:MAG: flagellar biosynthetic protein FliR [Hasllibacter sp.]
MNDVLADLGPHVAAGRAALLDGAGVFARVGAAAFFLPLLGERVVPVRVRLVCALALTAAVMPVIGPSIPDRLGILFLLTETSVGLAIGFGLRALVMAVQMGGTMVAQSISLAQFLGAPSAEPAPAVGHFLVVGALALVAMPDFPLVVVETIVAGYQLVPPGLVPPPGALAEVTIADVAGAFALALRLAAPFVALGLLYSLAIGFVSRAMPQLMVALVGAPAIVLAGIALLALSAPVMLGAWLTAFDGARGAP